MGDLEAEIIELEKQYPRYGGAKDHQIRALLGMSATSYYQILNNLLDDPAAAEAEPVLINRLRRIRDQRDHS